MEKAVFVAAAAALGVGISSASAAVAPSKSASSCAKLNKRYPACVAKNANAANRAVRDGLSRPSTAKAAMKSYRDNYTRLDRDGDGVPCES